MNKIKTGNKTHTLQSNLVDALKIARIGDVIVLPTGNWRRIRKQADGSVWRRVK